MRTQKAGTQVRKSLRSRIGTSLACSLLALAPLACSVGGQTGEPGCGGAPEGPVDEDEADALRDAAHRVEGSYEVPIFWLELGIKAPEWNEDRLAALRYYPSADEVLAESILHLEIEAGDEVTREKTCGRPGVAISVELMTEDGQIVSSFETVLMGEEPTDRVYFYGGSDGPPLSIHIDKDGPRGFVEVGDRQGAFPVPAGQSCLAQPLVEDVEAPIAFQTVIDRVDSLVLSHPDLFQGADFRINATPWRRHACVGESSEVSSDATSYRAWVESTMNEDSGDPFAGDLKVGPTDLCESCVAVELSGHKSVTEGPLLASAPEEVDEAWTAFRLELVFDGDEMIQGFLEYRAYASGDDEAVEERWEVRQTVELEP